MPTLRTWTSTLLTLLLLAGAALALPMGAVVGTVESEVPGQVAVYRCQPGPMVGLKPGDVVSLLRAGTSLGEGTVLRAAPELLISLKGVFECAPGDQVVYLRRPRGPETPRPAPKASPSAAPAVQASPAAAPAPAPAPLPMGAETPDADPSEEEPPAVAPSLPAATPAPPPAALPEDLAALQKWQADLGTRLRAYLRPRAKGKQTSPHVERLEKAVALTGKSRYADASSVYGKLGAALQQEGKQVLGSDAVRGREAWSLGLESLSLRALCLVLADDPDRARAAFAALARENPTGALASARALSLVRSRANAYTRRLKPAVQHR